MWFIVSRLIGSTIFAAVCYFASSSGRRPGRVALLALAALIPVSIYLSVAGFLQSLSTIVLACIVLSSGFRSKTAIAWALVPPLLYSYWYFGSAAVEVVARVERLRETYPVVSLVPRLAFEREPPPADVASTSARPKLPDDVEARLAQREGRGNYHWRQDRLRTLHGDITQEFIEATGFGLGRGRSIRSINPDLPERPTIPLPALTEESYPSADSQLHAAPSIARPTEAQTYATHQSAENDFLSAERMGYVESRERTIGFEPHGFAEAAKFRDPKDEEYRRDWPANDNWKVVRLELVSLLKHDPPAVYVSKNLPRMDELKDAAARPLDAFEQQALAKLRRDDDVIVDESPGVVRMLGALRAGNDCLACHRGSRGDLLGAFSYELRPARSATAPRPVKKADPQANLPREATRSLAAVVRAHLPADNRRRYRLPAIAVRPS